MSLRITVVVAIWIIYLSSPSSCQTVFLTVSTVQVGSTASFSCRVSPVSTATTVGFLKEGPPDIPVYSTAVGGVGSYINRVNGTEISRGHYEITLFNATLQDRGSYICNMILGIGTRSDTEELNVEKASVAEISPPSLETTEERKNQTFDCSSGPSYPAVNLTWSCIDVMCTVVHDTPENSTEMPPAVISKLQAMCPLHKSTNCTCEPSSGHSATATVTFVKNGATTETPVSGHSSFPWWAGLLIGIPCGVAVIGLIIFFVVRCKRDCDTCGSDLKTSQKYSGEREVAHQKFADVAASKTI